MLFRIACRHSGLDPNHRPLAAWIGRAAVFPGRKIDEDGVTFTRTLQAGQDASILVVASASGYLNAWIDFDGDGSWGGPWEQIANSVAVVNGPNVLRFDVPSWAAAGSTVARFRLSTTGNLGIRGLASDGEVEDHQVIIQPPSRASGVFGTPQTIFVGLATTIFVNSGIAEPVDWM